MIKEEMTITMTKDVMCMMKGLSGDTITGFLYGIISDSWYMARNRHSSTRRDRGSLMQNSRKDCYSLSKRVTKGDRQWDNLMRKSKK